MFNVFKRFKKQEAEIKQLKIERDAANQNCHMYIGWTSAYMFAIDEMTRIGELTEEENAQIYKLAESYMKYRERF